MTKLYVGGLPYSTTDESLLQLFAEKGYKPVSARIITDRETGRSRGFGFVELGPGDDAAKAIAEFNGLNIEGRALQVNEARPQESPRRWRSFRWRTRIFWRALWARGTWKLPGALTTECGSHNIFSCRGYADN